MRSRRRFSGARTARLLYTSPFPTRRDHLPSLVSRRHAATVGAADDRRQCNRGLSHLQPPDRGSWRLASGSPECQGRPAARAANRRAMKGESPVRIGRHAHRGAAWFLRSESMRGHDACVERRLRRSSWANDDVPARDQQPLGIGQQQRTQFLRTRRSASRRSLTMKRKKRPRLFGRITIGSVSGSTSAIHWPTADRIPLFSV